MADLIDRQALKDSIGLTQLFFVAHGDNKSLNDIINEAPAVDAEPVKHGRWEWRGGIPWCSNCGKMPTGYSYDGDVNTTNYCPNCGAKMDLEG